jgi:hemoglobin-like flavoprotein
MNLTVEGLSEQDVALIRDGAKLALMSPLRVAERFYEHVLAARPGLRTLFPSDLRSQQYKLVQTINVLLAAVDRLEELEPLLHRLGAAHRVYGAKAAHYPIINDALLAALVESGGAAFTPAHRRAFSHLLTYVAQTMLHGADGL